jgi:predicted nucleic acid-binding protein
MRRAVGWSRGSAVIRRQFAPVVIDTSLFLVIACWNRAGGAELTRRLDQLHSAYGGTERFPISCFENLQSVFHHARRRIVTGQVLAEAYNLRKRAGNSDWDSCCALIDEFDIEEHSCSMTELRKNKQYRTIAEEIGPTDAGLIHVAEKCKANLLTCDEATLGSWASKRSVPWYSLSTVDSLLTPPRA